MQNLINIIYWKPCSDVRLKHIHNWSKYGETCKHRPPLMHTKNILCRVGSLLRGIFDCQIKTCFRWVIFVKRSAIVLGALFTCSTLHVGLYMLLPKPQWSSSNLGQGWLSYGTSSFANHKEFNFVYSHEEMKAKVTTHIWRLTDSQIALLIIDLT